jgi:hypothetical protein
MINFFYYKNFSDRPGCVFLLIGAIFMLVGLSFLAIAIALSVQQQGYKAGQCTITAKQLLHELSTSTTTNTNSNGTITSTSFSTTDVFTPYFEYTVRTADGRNYMAYGYDGSNTYTSDRSGEQAIVDRYNIGQSYQCWYNPADPTHAILVRQTDWLFILIGGAIVLFGLLFVAVGILFLLGLFGSARRSWRYSSGG